MAGYLDGAGAAEVVVDGRDGRRSATGPASSSAPSLVDKVPTDSPLYTDEIFGPVLSVVRVDTYDEALKLVNDNPYGNGTAIFTRDGGAARQFQYDVVCGMVGVNVPVPGAGGVLQLRRLEGVALRRPAHVRPGRPAVLHPHQGGHLALAGPGHQPRSTSASRR